MTRARRALLSVPVVALLACTLGASTFGAMTSTTASPGNAFGAGTVHLSDNDAGEAMFAGTGTYTPSTPVQERCILVTYGGTLGADVRLSTASPAGDLGPYLDLTVTAGTIPAGTPFQDCTGFQPQGTALFTGTLTEFAGTHNTFDTGLSVTPAGGTQWNPTDQLVYRFGVDLRDDVAAQGKASTGIDFRWEARNG